MHRHPAWILFLCLINVCVLGYTIYFGILYWKYLRLDKQVLSEKIQWTILTQNDEKYTPVAYYHYRVHGKFYQGQALWPESYLNSSAAQEAIERLIASPPPVLFNQSNPQISSLVNHFPLKESIYAILLWIIVGYFIFLGFYIKRYLGSDTWK